MTQQWRIGIRGKRRKDVDVNLLIQAVIALGHQLRDEQQKHDAERKAETSRNTTTEGDSR
jgi:hypothetical protein